VRVDWEASAADNTSSLERENLDGVIEGSHVVDRKRFSIERIMAFHAGEDFETFDPGGLLQVGWDSSGLGTRTLDDGWAGIMMIITSNNTGYAEESRVSSQGHRGNKRSFGNGC